jgi:hypothetical protein
MIMKNSGRGKPKPTEAPPFVETRLREVSDDLTVELTQTQADRMAMIGSGRNYHEVGEVFSG